MEYQVSPKILIVDDEKLARDRLKRFMKEDCPAAIIDEAFNGIIAVEKIKSFSPDVVFLDIQMPGLSGFEVLQQVPERKFRVVFQTAYDEFAIKAFDENACDYLLKPFTAERFKKALVRALGSDVNPKNLEKLEKKIPYLERLIIKQLGKTKIVETDSIDYFISKDHYTCIYAGNEESVSELSLSWLEPRLDPKKFIRTHRNSIVSVAKVKSVGGTGDSIVELKNGATLALSRSNRKTVLEKIRDLADPALI
jgi:two-component system, LytTR family, response regulator